MGGKVELVGGKMVWCHPFNAPGQADGCFFIDVFALVVSGLVFFSLPSNMQRLVAGPVLCAQWLGSLSTVWVGEQ